MEIQTQTYHEEKKPQNGNVQKSTNNHGSLKDELRRLLAELLGTFALTLVAAGGEVIATISGGAVSPAARVVAPGLLVMAMIYTLGSQSGAHFNPCTGYLARPFLKMRREQRFSIVLFYNFLRDYASIFDFLQ